MSERALLGGRYELGPAIGSGGFATVYRARDRQTGADVAVKVVAAGLGSEALAVRLRSEAAALKKLSSRFVARVLDAGEDASWIWLVTELVDGVHLEPSALGRALLPHEVLRVARGLLEGLAAAHGAGVVHGDVKPSNILVPTTKEALDLPKLIDFGLARATPGQSTSDTLEAGREDALVGTVRYMAPEILRGAAFDARSDVYAAGLVLFDLLGEGPLFPGATASEQLRARLAGEPELDGRVPPPLAGVLARMLARAPERRFRDAGEAYVVVVELDTAPVSLRGDQTLEASARASLVPPVRTSVLPPHPRTSSTRFVIPDAGPPVTRALSSRPAPTPKLTSLPADGPTALRETLRYLDLAMVDALARRERGNAIGRVARAAALCLRLELDAAALILEPMAMQSDVARGVGAALLAPRARRVTRARVDSDREDGWIETVSPELGALLASVAVALGGREGAGRDEALCRRALARVEAIDRADPLRVTLEIAYATARVKRGELDRGAALDLVRPLAPQEDAARALPPLDRIARGLLLSAIRVRVDEARARDELERVVRVAAACGSTLFEACAAATWGRLLVDVPGRAEQALSVLDRATTLLAHGDAPTLEHEAEHHRAAALIVEGRWLEAIPILQRARAAARAERTLDLEVFSSSLEVVAHLASGDRSAGQEAAATLGDARIGTARGRAAGLAWVARALDAVASADREAADDALAEARARVCEAVAESADAYVLVEVLGLMLEAAHGHPVDVAAAAGDLERFAEEHGFVSFYWFDVLRAVLDKAPDPALRAPMRDALDRIAILLGPSSRLARERRTSAPSRGP